jgi:hypothetical protein
VTSDSIDWYLPALVAERVCDLALNVMGVE